ncbi:MAG: transposase [Saprospiraceae bacterium]
MRKQVKTEHTGKIPHFHRVGATFFITTHLHGSIPFDVLKKLKAKKDKLLAAARQKKSDNLEKEIYMIHRAYFYEYDKLLDNCLNSPTHLINPEVAKVVEACIRKYDQLYYNLVTFTIMPNHLHLVIDFSLQMRKIIPFDIAAYKNVSKVMNLIKGASGFEANKIIGNVGNPFWANGYYDRYIRSQQHYLGAVNYTINNVVKAKICNHWMEHPFTWLDSEYQKLELIFPNKG